eukprot:Rhum_TRINITY_DN4772_c0_g1::Rhum_TRINITY_DN4772_c0_g1_i1::g.15624::m.15624
MPDESQHRRHLVVAKHTLLLVAPVMPLLVDHGPNVRRRVQPRLRRELRLLVDRTPHRRTLVLVVLAAEGEAARTVRHAVVEHLLVGLLVRLTLRLLVPDVLARGLPLVVLRLLRQLPLRVGQPPGQVLLLVRAHVRPPRLQHEALLDLVHRKLAAVGPVPVTLHLARHEVLDVRIDPDEHLVRAAFRARQLREAHNAVHRRTDLSARHPHRVQSRVDRPLCLVVVLCNARSHQTTALVHHEPGLRNRTRHQLPAVFLRNTTTPTLALRPDDAGGDNLGGMTLLRRQAGSDDTATSQDLHVANVSTHTALRRTPPVPLSLPAASRSPMKYRYCSFY